MKYQIKDWNTHFENNKSRERTKCHYVCVPNKQHGMGFSRIMAEPDGAAIYGIWGCILGAASQQLDRDGWLTADGQQTGTAWAADDLAIKFHRPQAEIQRALDFLSSPKVGWIIVHKTEVSTNETEQMPADCPAAARPLSLNRIERKGIEQNRIESPLPPTGDEKAVTGIPVTEPETPKAAPVPAAPVPAPKWPLQLRAEKLMGRRPETPLTASEQRAFKKNKPCIEQTSEADWLALETFYAAPQEQTYARKDLATLVNNWNGEIDRAKAWNPNGMVSGERAAKLAELGRATRELASLGKASDYSEGSRSWNRIKELRPAIESLRQELGVIA
jgi:hypothetical protein